MQEHIMGYHKDSGPSKCVLKIDLMEVFDSVHWGFLLDAMEIMRFPSTFIKWIKHCLATHFTKKNGLVNIYQGYFKPISKDLRITTHFTKKS